MPEPERLLPEPVRLAVDSYLRSRSPPSFPADLVKRCTLSPAEARASGTAYNGPLINALVLYVGAAARSVTSPLNGPAMDIYLRLVRPLLIHVCEGILTY